MGRSNTSENETVRVTFVACRWICLLANGRVCACVCVCVVCLLVFAYLWLWKSEQPLDCYNYKCNKTKRMNDR